MRLASSFGRGLESRQACGLDWTGLPNWCDETTCDEDTTVASIGDTVSIARTSIGRDSEAFGH